MKNNTFTHEAGEYTVKGTVYYSDGLPFVQDITSYQWSDGTPTTAEEISKDFYLVTEEDIEARLQEHERDTRRP